MCKVGDTVEFPSGDRAVATRLDEHLVGFDLLDRDDEPTGEVLLIGAWFATWVKVVETSDTELA